MDIMCTDNRFEIIGKAKEHLLEATNIDTSPKEMEVLDNFLFRCWQMGWLDRYAEQTEPQTEEWHDDCNTCRWHDGACTIPCCDYEPKTEPQTDNGIGCSKCESRFWCMDRDMPHAVHCNNYGKTEPSTDCSWK